MGESGRKKDREGLLNDHFTSFFRELPYRQRRWKVFPLRRGGETSGPRAQRDGKKGRGYRWHLQETTLREKEGFPFNEKKKRRSIK